MRLFYHVVGLPGSADFSKTVTKKWKWDEIENALDLRPDQKNALQRKVRDELGDSFSIWGVPAGAERVWNNLRENDSYILLVTSIAIHDPSIRYGGLVGSIVPGFQHGLSRLLWQSDRYSLIYFFQPDLLDTNWFDFRDAVGYPDTYRPPARIFSVRDDRAAGLCNGRGPAAYIDSVRIGHVT